VEKSAIPAKGDRGRSESDIERSYAECRRTTPGSPCVESCFGRAVARLGTLRSGSAGDVQRRPSPVGVENAGRWKWRLFSFPGELLNVISRARAGNGRRPGERPFSDGQRYLHEGEHCEDLGGS
jgi:hypothetical protein